MGTGGVRQAWFVVVWMLLYKRNSKSCELENGQVVYSFDFLGLACKVLADYP